ncbi:alpha/beta hydrolase family esterase [Trichococcus sp.]|uniref:alpha/beta hydrolase family esterase n=1 Tax=Trichococcus sp. TaxID=1985464 RepID=UPI003C7AEA23
MIDIISTKALYYYISSKAGCDPCKTIYLCAPAEASTSIESAEQFAVTSGWQAIAEEQEAILVVPVALNGWDAEPISLLMDIYNETKNSFHTRSGEAIWGRTGTLWCWETILYLVGYEEGATFAGNVLISHPNMFAGVALVNGVPNDYSKAEAPSSHWMIKTVSEDYAVKNSEIPVHLWLFEENEEVAQKAADYFGNSRSNDNPAEQVRLFVGDYSSEDARLSQMIFEECFNHVIRWKNSPDGTLAQIDSKKEFYADPRFIRKTAVTGERSYDYFIHLPEKKTVDQVKGLPLVFTLHGRGEPAWMFTTKNGWDILADETQEFVMVSLDSPGNIWFVLRDNEVFEKVIAQMIEEYRIDETRVYLTGFSNGAIMTREMAYCRPHLFAGISPSNGPWFDSRSMQLKNDSKPPKEMAPEVSQMMKEFEKSGWEMPCAFFYGDNDPAADARENPALKLMLRVNDCEEESSKVYTEDNYFTLDKGYKEGDRFQTEVYCREDQSARVCVTVMKNMPHGAIAEEARFTWEFLKQFCRPKGSKKVLNKIGKGESDDRYYE